MLCRDTQCLLLKITLGAYLCMWTVNCAAESHMAVLIFDKIMHFQSSNLAILTCLKYVSMPGRFQFSLLALTSEMDKN